MKERALSAVLAQMPPAEAKKLTEALAKQFTDAQAAARAAQQVASAPAAATPPAKPTAARPTRPRVSARAKTARRKSGKSMASLLREGFAGDLSAESLKGRLTLFLHSPR